MTMFTLSIFSVLGLRDQSLSYEEPVFTLLVGLCKVGKKRTKFILTQMFPSTRPAVSSTPKPAVEQRTAHTLAVPVPISDARSPRTPSCRQLQAAADKYMACTSTPAVRNAPCDGARPTVDVIYHGVKTWVYASATEKYRGSKLPTGLRVTLHGIPERESSVRS